MSIPGVSSHLTQLRLMSDRDHRASCDRGIPHTGRHTGSGTTRVTVSLSVCTQLHAKYILYSVFGSRDVDSLATIPTLCGAVPSPPSRVVSANIIDRLHVCLESFLNVWAKDWVILAKTTVTFDYTGSVHRVWG